MSVSYSLDWQQTEWSCYKKENEQTVQYMLQFTSMNLKVVNALTFNWPCSILQYVHENVLGNTSIFETIEHVKIVYTSMYKLKNSSEIKYEVSFIICIYM